MKTFQTVLLIFTLFFLSGCVSAELNYSAPEKKHPIITSKVSNKTFNKAWKEVVSQISSHHLVINNIEKDSGLINVSFSTSDTSKYIDCGKWQGHFKNLRGERKYNFKGESSTQFSSTDGTNMLNTSRSVDLSGRVNVLLQNDDTKKTTMTVNVRYVLSVKDKTTTSDPYYHGGASFNNWNVSFGTNEQGQNSGGQTQCISTGYLEKLLLSYLK